MKVILTQIVLLPFLSSLSLNPTVVIVIDDVSFEAAACILSLSVLLSVREFIDSALFSVLMSRKNVFGRWLLML